MAPSPSARLLNSAPPWLAGAAARLLGKDAFSGVAGRPTPAEDVAKLAGDGWELTTLPVNGAQLTGLVREPSSADAPWVLFFAGLSDQLLKGSRAHMSELIGERDVGVASFAYRGFDTSTGFATPESFADDALAQVDLLKARGVGLERLHVIGFSLGTASASLLGEALAARGERPASTTFLSPGIGPAAVAPWALPFLRGPFQLRRAYAATPSPALMIAATRDQALPVDVHAHPARDALAERCVRYLELDGAHVATLEAPEALLAVRDFVGI